MPPTQTRPRRLVWSAACAALLLFTPLASAATGTARHGHVQHAAKHCQHKAKKHQKHKKHHGRNTKCPAPPKRHPPSPRPTPSHSPTPVGIPTSSSPSGENMPAGNLPGWRQVFADDFPGTSVDTDKWGVYRGRPGSDPGTQWSPSHVHVAGGVLDITTYRDPAYGGEWTSGGINNARAEALSSGFYEIRMRADRAPGVTAVGLLWPKSNSWPPEIDFVEDRSGHRTAFTATLHYRDDGTDKQAVRDHGADLTEWHTYGVQWSGDRVVYLLDGHVWATVTSPEVPAVPMGLAIQTNAVTQNGQTASIATPPVSQLQVDWVVGYTAD